MAAVGVTLAILVLSVNYCATTPQETGRQCTEAHLTSPYCTKFAQESLQIGMEDFTQAFYLHMVREAQSPNFVFSPLSLHSAITMLYLGTPEHSETSVELEKVLGAIGERRILNSGYRNIVNMYRAEENFLFANNFWLQTGLQVNENFKHTIRDNMNSGVENIDFRQATSVDTVNNWIKEMTGGKIKKLIDGFQSGTRIILTNALYFKEKWEVPFEDEDIYGDPLFGMFKTAKSGLVNVPMIRQISPNTTYGEIRIGRTEVEVLSIPYKNPLFEMQIILPKSLRDLNILESQMNMSDSQATGRQSRLFFNIFSEDKTVSEEYIEEVLLQMPTFNIKTDLDAVDPLKQLGVNKVFSDGAELDELVSGSGPITVSKISHTSLIEVSKEGTEGASATGAEIVQLSAGFGGRKVIVVDRPFLFVVQDKVNKIPVLVGRVTDPMN